jgi:hypothetical protein
MEEPPRHDPIIRERIIGKSVRAIAQDRGEQWTGLLDRMFGERPLSIKAPLSASAPRSIASATCGNRIEGRAKGAVGAPRSNAFA